MTTDDAVLPPSRELSPKEIRAVRAAVSAMLNLPTYIIIQVDPNTNALMLADKITGEIFGALYTLSIQIETANVLVGRKNGRDFIERKVDNP